MTVPVPALGRVAALGLAVALTGAACATGGEAAGPSEAESVEAALIESGHRSEVVECVLRLAADDLARGPLSDTAVDELIGTCEDIRAALDDDPAMAEDEVEAAPPSGPTTRGDDPVLDELWAACEEGSGAACDELFELAPVGSEYEAFGLSCGERQGLLHCRELDGNEAAQP